jgi:LmbE family N-acetylglucosaminyl deacetylase
MIKLGFEAARGKLDTVLCLGAHSDDIEIGCGGTILKLLEEHPGLKFHWVVFSATPERKKEAQKSAELFLKGAKSPAVAIENFRDSFFPYDGAAIKEFFQGLSVKISPDVVFTHYRNDLHQDHRVISELTLNAFRNHLILEYEIAKYDGDLGQPNFFCGLEEKLCSRKIKNILAAFQSQAKKHWFDEETFRALLRLRGVECNAPEKYAEAFYCRKAIF